jgi:hypothetical protein
MKNKLFLTLLMWTSLISGFCATVAEKPYTEADDGVRANKELWKQLEEHLYVSWASRDVHYVKTAIPQLRVRTDTIVYAWRGERVGIEAVLFSPVYIKKLSLRTSDWAKTQMVNGQWSIVNDGTIIPASQCTARFLRYVLTDDFKTCGTHPSDLAPYLVPDVIDLENSMTLPAYTTRPVWLTLEVPRDAEPGIYTLTLDIVETSSQTVKEQLTLRVNVQENVLPLPSEQAFHLDFWQQPYSLSRYESVGRWSNKHFELLRPYMELLARAGQSVVSTILFYEPWGSQSYDKFDPMIKTTKKRDGSWSYDYSIFDRWVEFMASCGIDKQIDCFTMIPWDMTFRYYDEAQGKEVALKTTTSASEYKELWISFLTSFAAHLQEKGWFEKTMIAMDERDVTNMQEAYNVAQEAVPGFRMALAGHYHQELVNKLADYCISFWQTFSAEELQNRRAKGWFSTTYTCCSTKKPNIFTNSLPAEAAFIPVFCIANDFDGFLHWSWMNWPENPLTDSRFKFFAPGDTYCIYPGPRSSVRWERFIEGIQQTEKIRILREQYQAEGNTKALNKLNKAVEACSTSKMTYYESASKRVNYLESVLNNAPEPPEEEVFAYCPVMLDDEQRDAAIEKRWLSTVTTTNCLQDLEYSTTTHSVDGYVRIPTPIIVQAGKSFRLRTIAAQNDDDLRYCREVIYADWNCDSIFDHTSSEKITSLGKAKTANTEILNHIFTIRVPATATPGPSRLRICFADAWRDEPMPCGEMYKGFAMDIPMHIVTEDTPVKDMLEPLPYWEGKTLHLPWPATLAIYNSAGALVDMQQQTQNYTITGYLPGIYIIEAVKPNGERLQFKFATN